MGLFKIFYNYFSCYRYKYHKYNLKKRCGEGPQLIEIVGQSLKLIIGTRCNKVMQRNNIDTIIYCFDKQGVYFRVKDKKFPKNQIHSDIKFDIKYRNNAVKDFISRVLSLGIPLSLDAGQYNGNNSLIEYALQTHQHLLIARWDQKRTLYINALEPDPIAYLSVDIDKFDIENLFDNIDKIREKQEDEIFYRSAVLIVDDHLTLGRGYACVQCEVFTNAMLINHIDSITYSADAKHINEKIKNIFSPASVQNSEPHPRG